MATVHRFSGEQRDMNGSGDVPTSLACRSCKSYAIRAYQINCCGAFVCETCQSNLPTYNSSTPHSPKCPHCDKVLGSVQLDFIESNLRANFSLSCPNKATGCKWENKAAKFLDHQSVCLFAIVTCWECKIKLTRSDLHSHRANTCQSRMVQCQYCGDSVRHYHLKHHQFNGCSGMPRPCPHGCQQSVTLPSLQNHERECARYPLPCIFVHLGCQEKPMKKDLPHHVCTKMSHMEMLLKENERCSTLINQLLDADSKHKEQINSLKKTIGCMQKKLDCMEKAIGSQQATNQSLHHTDQKLQSEVVRVVRELNCCQNISNEQKKILVDLEVKYQQLKEEHSRLIKECKMELDAFCQTKMVPQFKFIVTKVDHLTRTDSGFLSPYFYTQCCKHKLQLCVYPGGKDEARGRSVSVWLYCIKEDGIANDQVPDQFKIIVKVELVNQLPMAVENTGHCGQLDLLVAKNEPKPVAKMNAFIEIAGLDNGFRVPKLSILQKRVQYKTYDSLSISVICAVEVY